MVMEYFLRICSPHEASFPMINASAAAYFKVILWYTMIYFSLCAVSGHTGSYNRGVLYVCKTVHSLQKVSF